MQDMIMKDIVMKIRKLCKHQQRKYSWR